MDPLASRRRRRIRDSYGVVLLWTLVLQLWAAPRAADSLAVDKVTVTGKHHNNGGQQRRAIGDNITWKRKQCPHTLLRSVYNAEDTADTSLSATPRSTCVIASTSTAPTTTTEQLNDKIAAAFHPRDHGHRSWNVSLREALDLLDPAEAALMQKNAATSRAAPPYPNHATYTLLLTTLATLPEDVIRETWRPNGAVVVDAVDALFQRLQRVAPQFSGLDPATVVSNAQPVVVQPVQPPVPPTTVDYNAVLLAYSQSHRREAGARGVALLAQLWARYDDAPKTTNTTLHHIHPPIDKDDHHHYNKDDDEETVLQNHPYCPTMATYVSVLLALVRSGTGRVGAEQAEAVLEEMERRRRQDGLAHLRPTTFCVNLVLYVVGCCDVMCFTI